MSDPKKGFKVKVDPGLPDESKFKRFHRMIRDHVAKLRDPSELVALGVLLKFWLAVMRKKDDGQLLGWGPEDIAIDCGWDGPPLEALMQALLECGKNSVEPEAKGFLVPLTNGYAVYKWAEWQGDPSGTRAAWAERARRSRENFKKRRAGAAAAKEPKPDIGPKEESVRQILQAMSKAHTPGSHQQKAEYARAWLERPGVGGAKVLEVLWSPEARGQGVFWLDSRLGGTAPAKPAGTTGGKPPSTLDALKKWAGVPPAAGEGK